MIRSRLLSYLRRNRYAGQPSTPGGRPLHGDALAWDLGFQAGWNACSRDIERQFGQGDVTVGLAELRDNAPLNVEREHCGEGG